MTLDLFTESDYNDEPILYFGYQKNRIGEFVNPQLIYIDEGNIEFAINQSDIQMTFDMTITNVNTDIVEVKPKLKENNVLKEAK